MRGNSKIAAFGLMILWTSALASSVSAQTKDWNIADYVKNLPEKYITATGDFPKPTAKIIMVDEKKGYAAASEDFPVAPAQFAEAMLVFQANLFKS